MTFNFLIESIDSNGREIKYLTQKEKLFFVLVEVYVFQNNLIKAFYLLHLIIKTSIIFWLN
ncbi:hypothetical protein pb186bvf_009782 [Paramecium bursaria]